MKIVSVKVNGFGKVLYYNATDYNVKKNLTVIVRDEKGLQFAKIVDVFDDDNIKCDSIVRVATKRDYLKHLSNIDAAKVAFDKCKDIVKKDKLNLTILDATYNFDRSQLLFRFLSDERVDFRNLAKELGSKFRTRIELRQIGIRDKAKELGGFGPCGRNLCCNTFLTNFDTVSINMAKNQGIALNPTKINGVCGRLLCCLNYENDAYTEARKKVPEIGKKVFIGEKEGKVVISEPLIGKYKVLIDNEVVEVDVNDSTK